MHSAVIKVGGSLARSKSTLTRLCSELSDLGKHYHLIIVPGGGVFADEVRRAYRKFKLSEDTAHWMAIMATNQFGLLLSELTGFEALEILDKNRTFIFLPFRMFWEEDPLPHSWDVTSDSIAAYVAWKASAQRLVILTDVDGIFSSDPKRDHNARLLECVEAETLASLRTPTSVDPYFPKLVSKYKLEAWILNGEHPERLKVLLSKGETLGTKII